MALNLSEKDIHDYNESEEEAHIGPSLIETRLAGIRNNRRVSTDFQTLNGVERRSASAKWAKAGAA